MKTSLRNISHCGVIALAIGALCCSNAAFAAEKKSEKKKAEATELDSADKEFMMEAAKGGMMEVEMGKMAEQKAKSPDVKKFGKRMVTDHTKANNELMALAKTKGVTLDTSKSMEKVDDANFDQDYIDKMVKDHEKDVAAFEKEAKDGKDPDVKAWAKKTLPTLKKHLELAKETQAKLKKS
jgi:putative membrane protein